MEIYVEIKKRFPEFNLDIKFYGSKERIGLLGSSGSGKSMTLRCIAGLVKPDEGRIVVNGKTYFDSEKKIDLKPQNRKAGFLFQNYALFTHLTIKQNIAFGIMGLSHSQKIDKVMNLIEKFHLTGLENRYPHQISGGQQQRVALARTIAAEPEIILLDEPFSALDEHLRSHMTQEMLEYLNEYNGNTIFVTHSIEEAYRICENLAILSNGNIHVFGNKKEVFENPKTSEAAKITNCKNIVRSNRVDNEFIEVPSWNIKLKSTSDITKYDTTKADTTKADINFKSGYCGIRANHIELGSEVISENIFSAIIVGNIETLFGQTVYLKFENAIHDSNDYHIQWETSKDLWNSLNKESQLINIYLPKDKIMFFEN